MIVPSEFQKQIKVAYPHGNLPILEEWLIDNITESTKREFIPINWCGYFVNHNYGNDKSAMRRLQSFVNRIDKTKKYWVYTQYDLGILTDLSHLDVMYFGSGGGKIDFPLPLVCQPHGRINCNKDVFASFVGSVTHPIRSRLIKNYPSDWYVSTEHHSIGSFCEILSRSIYAISPRGFGLTSFRICEALEQGSIPVYISDQFIIPGNIDFENYGVLIHSGRVEEIDQILASISPDEIAKKQVYGQMIYEKMFTFEGCRQLIMDNI